MTAIRQQLLADSEPHAVFGPVILNCISGAERSGLLALAMATQLATRLERPTLISECLIDVAPDGMFGST